MALLDRARDRRTPAQQRVEQERALRSQVVDVVGPGSPFWRQRLAALGRTPEQVATPDALRGLPAAGERDLCPGGDPAGAARLVLQAGERDWALHAEGPRLRRALLRRLLAPGSYAAQLEADLRPTSFTLEGLALRFPVASTRADLDLVARAGARLWRLLGLDRGDVLVALAAPGAGARALELAALASGAPAALTEDVDAWEALLTALPATVLALPADRAAAVLDAVDPARVAGVRLVLLLGPHTAADRTDVREAAEAAGARVDVLPLHAASAHRLLWAPCREGGAEAGLHLQPDLELVQLVDPETGADTAGAGEVVVTQLGARGSALLRWRTGDLAAAVTGPEPCPGCGRTLPRVLGLQAEALVPALRSGRTDLRAVTAALAGRPDLADWRVELDRRDQLLVHVRPTRGADPAGTCVAVARAVRDAAGALPHQVVLAAEGLPDGDRVTPRVVRARRSGARPVRTRAG